MRYSEKFKNKMVKKLTGPGAWSALALSKESGVSQSALSRWVREAKSDDMTIRKEKGRPPVPQKRRRWTAERKLDVVMRAYSSTGDELGALLRAEGLHEEQLAEFQDEVKEAAIMGLRKTKKTRKCLHPAEKELQLVKKELARKERALAETAALLVLQGKVQAFFGESEEGDTTESSDG